MSLRPPGHRPKVGNAEDALGLLNHEIAGEMASALGRAGRKVEATLAVLRGFDGDASLRPPLVKDAAEAVYAYFIQRELCGMRRHQDVIREYAIPGEVLARLGAK